MGRKRGYTRRGPVGVLAQNIAAVARHAHLASRRLDNWSLGGDPVLVEARDLAIQIYEASTKLGTIIEGLLKSNFVPPPRTELPLQRGEHVSVKAEHRKRYEVVYAHYLSDDPGTLDDLVVESILETGEVLVKRGRKAPFPARKSHLVRVTEET